MQIDLNNLSEYKENNQIEAKKAKSNIPNSIWETYSSFSNTDGGVILLGVVEKDDDSFAVTGVEDADKLLKDFWNMINNREKVNVNLLTNRMVQIQEVEGKQILTIMVPRADRRLRPVYVGTVKSHPEYKVTDTPSRTSICLPYTVKALQEAGKLLVEEKKGVTTRNINSTPQTTTQKTDDTPSVKSLITDKLKLSGFITDKSGLSVADTDNIPSREQNTDKLMINDEIIDVLVKVWLFVNSHPHTNSNIVATSIGKGRESAKKYLQRLAEIGLIVPEGANRNRTYSTVSLNP